MNILFEPVSIHDVELILKWKQEPYFQKMALDNQTIITLNNQLQDIKAATDSEYQYYDIIQLNKKPVGYIRVDWIDQTKKIAWLRFAMGESRNNGIMSKALDMYVNALFNNGCHRIECEVYAYNIPSQKVVEKIGFVKEGTKRAAHQWFDRYYDVFAYGLLKKDIKK
jgi:RimJ/RimL family protein N-acetyltransferase